MALKYWLRGVVLENNIPILECLTINIGIMSDKSNLGCIISSPTDGTFEYEVPEVTTLVSSESVIKTDGAYDSLLNAMVTSIGLVTDGDIVYVPYDEESGTGDYRISPEYDGIEWVEGGNKPEDDSTYFVDYYYYSESYFVTAFYKTDKYNARIFDYVKPVIEKV